MDPPRRRALWPAAIITPQVLANQVHLIRSRASIKKAQCSLPARPADQSAASWFRAAFYPHPGRRNRSGTRSHPPRAFRSHRGMLTARATRPGHFPPHPPTAFALLPLTIRTAASFVWPKSNNRAIDRRSRFCLPNPFSSARRRGFSSVTPGGRIVGMPSRIATAMQETIQWYALVIGLGRPSRGVVGLDYGHYGHYGPMRRASARCRTVPSGGADPPAHLPGPVAPGVQER